MSGPDLTVTELGGNPTHQGTFEHWRTFQGDSPHDPRIAIRYGWYCTCGQKSVWQVLEAAFRPDEGLQQACTDHAGHLTMLGDLEAADRVAGMQLLHALGRPL